MGADPAAAGITSITVGAVITGQDVIRVAATYANCAHVVSADISVSAEGIVWCSVAGSACAGVCFRTGYTVITGQDVIRVAAAHSNCAHVVGADVSVRAQCVVGGSVTDTA
jgi:hypothetical protein